MDEETIDTNAATFCLFAGTLGHIYGTALERLAQSFPYSLVVHLGKLGGTIRIQHLRRQCLEYLEPLPLLGILP